MANVPKAQIKTKLAQILKSKEEQIAIFGLKTKFGGGRTTGFATIYDSVDLRKKYDSKKMLRRVSIMSNIRVIVDALCLPFFVFVLILILNII